MGRHSIAQDHDPAGEETADRPRFARRHRKAIIAVICLAALPLLILSGYALYIDSSLKNIDRIAIDTDDDGRPAGDSGESILLMGVDQGNRVPVGASEFNIANDSKRAVWPTDKYHSDTMMIVHMSKDRRNISVVSVPRDSYVDLYDSKGEEAGRNRVNAALTEFGPSAAVTTVEQLVGIRIDHLAMVDFQSFEAIANALGGITVHIPKTVYRGDTDSIEWEKGDLELDGKTALRYVRERNDLPKSDYSRINRQQNFLRAALSEAKSKGTLTNPARLKSTLDAVTKNLSVDENWSTSNIRGLAFSLRKAAASDIQFVTLPIDGYSKMIDGIGSVITPDQPKIAELAAAIREGNVKQFVKKYPKQGLGDETEVR